MSLLPPLAPTFEAALRDVRAKRVEMRLAATDRLANAEPERTAEALAALLLLGRDRDARVRGLSMLALAQLAQQLTHESDAAVPRELLAQLRAGLRDEQPHVREQAMLAFVELGGAAASEAVHRQLSSEHPEVRFQAALGYPEAADDPRPDLLAALLDDSDKKVRTAAALSLAQLDDSRGAEQLALSLDDPDFAHEAVDALGEVGGPEQIPPLAAIAGRVLVSPMLKVAAARALCRLADPRGVLALRDVLHSIRREGRAYAVEIVGQLALTELAEDLERLARRPRGCDRMTLANALAALATDSEAARRGLQTLARRRDAAAERARQVLSQI